MDASEQPQPAEPAMGFSDDAPRTNESSDGYRERSESFCGTFHKACGERNRMHAMDSCHWRRDETEDHSKVISTGLPPNASTASVTSFATS
ncbi:MAG: hypothetical protein ACI85K_001016 [Hyphomicrobiaceae bacterium]|jgi:hypothetical protein